MLVDDDEAIRMVNRMWLEDAGLDVVEASDGREALAMLRDGPRPDLIVLDVMMPEMNGWGTLRELRDDPDLREIPVVIYTAVVDDDYRQGALKLGVAGYLIKPLDPDAFVAHVRNTLRNDDPWASNARRG